MILGLVAASMAFGQGQFAPLDLSGRVGVVELHAVTIPCLRVNRGCRDRDSNRGDDGANGLCRRGEVKGCRWVRMTSVVSSAIFFETLASADGKAVFENVPGGMYVVIALGPKGVCETGLAEVRGGKFEDVIVGRR